MKKLFLRTLLILLLMQVATADMSVGFMASYSAYSFILLIPVVLLESIAAHLYITKSGFKIKFMYVVWTFTFANVFSTIVGFFIPFILHNANLGPILLRPLILELILTYPITVVLETPLVYFFIRNKTKKGLNNAMKLSFIANIVTYVPQAALMVILNIY